MKIIKPGFLPENHDRYKGTCRQCGCVVEAEKNEVREGWSGVDANHGYYVNCPTDGCGTQIAVTKIVYRSGA